MPAADLILNNAHIITLDTALPAARTVAISGERIIAVGGNEVLEAARGADTRVIDCGGKTIIPGFNDAHCHIIAAANNIFSLDISPSAVRSIEDIKAAIFQKAAITMQGRWITASGYNEFHLAEKRHPTRRDLDAISPNHPVVLFHRSMHACVLNSRALELAKIGNETEEPPGATIERFLDTGEPNGLLLEMVGYITSGVLPPLTDSEMEKSLAAASQHYLSLGITSLQDATATNDFSRWQQFRRLKEKGVLKSRISMMIGSESMADFLKQGLKTSSGDDNLRLGAVKLMLNDNDGTVHPAQEELNRIALEADKRGFQIAIHAVRAVSVEAAANALERIRARRPSSHLRHRIEHCSECPTPLLEKLKKSRAVVVTQPPFIYASGERYLATVPAEGQKSLYRIKSLMDSGLVVAGSSDSPVATDNPLLGIYAAVTRRAENGQALLPQEGISPIRALEMYTRHAAYAAGEEKLKGSITAGKLADLVLLSEDPTAVTPEKIKDIKAEMTILGGEVAWEG